MTWTLADVEFYQHTVPPGWLVSLDDEGTLVIQPPVGANRNELAIAEHVILNIEKPLRVTLTLTIPDARMLAVCREAAANNGLRLVALGEDRYRLEEDFKPGQSVWYNANLYRGHVRLPARAAEVVAVKKRVLIEFFSADEQALVRRWVEKRSLSLDKPGEGL